MEDSKSIKKLESNSTHQIVLNTRFNTNSKNSIQLYSNQSSYNRPQFYKAKQTVLEEDDYYKYLEEIIKRDYFPDLIKMEAYKEYIEQEQQKAYKNAMGLKTGSTQRSVRAHNIPSVLLKETPLDKDIFDRRDPFDKFLERKRDPKGHEKNKKQKINQQLIESSEYQSQFDFDEDQKRKAKDVDVSKMGLDEYLRRFTSEDNSSFQEIHQKDRQKFLNKIAWMFNDHDKYANLNQLSIENQPNLGQPKTLLSEAQQLDEVNKFNSRTVPGLTYGDHEPLSSLFFRKPEEDLGIVYDHQIAIQEKLEDINAKETILINEHLIKKSNTRLPSKFLAEFLDKDEKIKQSIIQKELDKKRGVFPTQIEFKRPLDKELLNGGGFKRPFDKRNPGEPSIDLSDMMAINRGQKPRNSNQTEQTPMINGFKLIQGTPIRSSDNTAVTSKKIQLEESPMITWGKIEGKPLFLGTTEKNENKKQYSIPQISVREDLSIKMANKTSSKKREEKAKQKKDIDRKLQGTALRSTQDLSDAGKKLLTNLIKTNQRQTGNSNKLVESVQGRTPLVKRQA
ncbi:protein dgcr14 [Stylonychia lemnae]|uniref:Protein dgcr14 n=1 Tax=Stylonychia lemnae TaxID=5949 RepID=A0A078AMH5_STYLE|nr:protein dgcr14 [Stylonychia lemnae]|eukprot:CDW83585.1 protein dgcr14 [Stylonychia lemnae]